MRVFLSKLTVLTNTITNAFIFRYTTTTQKKKKKSTSTSLERPLVNLTYFISSVVDFVKCFFFKYINATMEAYFDGNEDFAIS